MKAKETKFRTTGTIPNDNELPPNFAHSTGRYRERRERGECYGSEAECGDNRKRSTTLERNTLRQTPHHYRNFSTSLVSIPAINQVVV